MVSAALSRNGSFANLAASRSKNSSQIDLSTSPPIPSGALTPSLRKAPDGIASKYPAILAKLPVPKLEDTCERYLAALEGLQDEEEHARTKAVVKEFLESGEGAGWQAKLEAYNKGVDSYIEEFWCEFVLGGRAWHR